MFLEKKDECGDAKVELLAIERDDRLHILLVKKEARLSTRGGVTERKGERSCDAIVCLLGCL